MTDYRCDTGGCPQVTCSGDTVTIVETANPGQVVVTPAAKWDAYLDTVRAQERAAIVAWLLREHENLSPSTDLAWKFGWKAAAKAIERGEFDDLAAGESLSTAIRPSLRFGEHQWIASDADWYAAIQHASPGCACGINGAGDRFVDSMCAKRSGR